MSCFTPATSLNTSWIRGRRDKPTYLQHLGGPIIVQMVIYVELNQMIKLWKVLVNWVISPNLQAKRIPLVICHHQPKLSTNKKSVRIAGFWTPGKKRFFEDETRLSFRPPPTNTRMSLVNSSSYHMFFGEFQHWVWKKRRLFCSLKETNKNCD